MQYANNKRKINKLWVQKEKNIQDLSSKENTVENINPDIITLKILKKIYESDWLKRYSTSAAYLSGQLGTIGLQDDWYNSDGYYEEEKWW